MLLPPLVVAVLALLAGLLPALRFAPPPVPLLLSALAVLAYWWSGLRSPACVDRSRVLLPSIFLLTGATLGAGRVTRVDCRAEIPDGARVQVEGVLGAGVFAEGGGEGPPLLPLEHARIHQGAASCAAPVRIILPVETPTSLAGSRLTADAVWKQARRHGPESRWPPNGYRVGYLRADGVPAIESPRFVRNPFLTLRGLSEAHLHRLFPTHFAMVEALVLGRRERLDPAVRTRFSMAGLSHLLAISGSHVGILAGVLLIVGGAARLPRRRITFGTITLIGAYLLLIGAPASAVRAGAMISLALLALLLQRPSAAMPIAAAACLLILALDPLAVLDVGMQLSFAGVFGIMAVHRIVGGRLGRLTRGTPWRWLAETMLVSAAAFVATAPITAYHFGTIAPISILSNVPAIPLTALALIGIVAAAVTAPLAPLADALAAGAGLALDLLDRCATIAASIPYGSTVVERPHLAGWLAAASAAGAIYLRVRRARPAVRLTIATGAGTAALIVWPVVAVLPVSGLEIHFLDVGQGDAVALRTPRGRWILVDAGPRSTRFDAGERLVVPFFRARGVGRIEALILTHGDADHIGGAPAVIRALRVERIVEPGVALGRDLYLELLEGVRVEEAEWVPARGGRGLRIDDVELTFLWPDSSVLARADDPNDASAITLVRYGGFSLILPGDASAWVEKELVRRHGSGLRAQVLKAGHHGSATSTSADFLRAVRPGLVVISAGRGNRYGHPSPEVLARLRAAGVEVARTDLDGTISLRVPSETAEPVRIR